MKAHVQLHALIRSLSPSEKRYFRIFADGQGNRKGKDYMRVFDLVEDMETYDEEALLDQLGRKKFASQLPVVKHYLYGLILKSLRNFHAGKSPEFRLREMLMNAELLIRRDLTSQGLRQLEKARKLAVKYEKFDILLEILSLRISTLFVAGESDLEKLDQQLEKAFQETDEIFDRYKNIQTYRKLSYQMLLLNRKEQSIRTERVRKAYEQIMELPLLQEETLARSAYAKLYYYQCHFIFHFAGGNYGECLEYGRRMVDLMEENEVIIEERPENYLNTFQNLLSVSTMCLPPEETLVEIERFKGIPDRLKSTRLPPHLAVRIPFFAHNLELGTLLGLRDTTRGIPLILEIEEWLKKHDIRFNTNEGFVLLDMYFNMARLLFMAGELARANTYINKVIHFPGINTQYDIYLHARILQVVVLYELGEQRLLEYAVKSLYRYLSKRKRLQGFESAVLRFLRRTADARPGEDVALFFEQLREELRHSDEIHGSHGNMGYFDLLNWLDRRTGKPENEKGQT